MKVLVDVYVSFFSEETQTGTDKHTEAATVQMITDDR